MIKKYMDPYGIKKSAFEIKIDPASILGAITGGVIANKKVQKDHASELKNIMSLKNDVTGNYYQQVENLSNNTFIVFTPLGVLYVLKDGPSELVVDQISVSDMDENVRQKFREQDRQFFKNIMINKVRSDVDIAQRAFVNRMINKKMDMGFNKNASEQEHFQDLRDLYEKKAESEILQYLIDDEPIFIKASFSDEIDINKYASLLSKPLIFKNLFSNIIPEDDVQGNLADPNYVAKRAEVGFLPDRVIFTLENKVLGQLNILDMNEEGFEAFQKNDREYFYDFFQKALGFSERKAIDIFKRASDINDLKNVFRINTIHPIFYFNLLNSKLGDGWVSYDPEVLIKSIEESFMLDHPISDIALDKILMIQAANNPEAILFKNITAFEKLVRTMNDKPIDFTESEPNISLEEIVFALRAIDIVTPFDDIYDNLSEGVYSYIVSTLANQNYRLIYPETKTPLEKIVFDNIDIDVRFLISKDLAGEQASEKDILKVETAENLVAAKARLLVSNIREEGIIPTDFNAYVLSKREEIDKVLNMIGHEDPEMFFIKVARSIEDNIAVDIYLNFRDKQLEEYNQELIR